MMKQYLSLALALVLVFSLAACGGTPAISPAPSDAAPQTPDAVSHAPEPTEVTIKSLNAEKEEVELVVPYQPERIVVLDFAALDMIDNYGFGERVVGSAKGSSISYLQSYMENESIVNCGTIKTADLEAVMTCEPDVIFIGGRLASIYNELSEFAPVVFLSTDAQLGTVESVRKNALTIASMFGCEDLVDGKLSAFDARIAALQAFAADKTAIVGLATGGAFNVLGNDGRCSMIGREIGFENIGVDANIDTSTHGNEASYEFIADKNPQYIFCLDRDAAISTDGAAPAAELLDNALVNATEAGEHGNVIVLEHSDIWYTAEGGITALDLMLADLENSLLG